MVQFQIPVWAANGTCTAPLILVDTLHQITVAQRKSGNKPIVVHGRCVGTEGGGGGGRREDLEKE